MPFFGKRENVYVVTLQCGASRDAYLEIELLEGCGEIEELYELPSMERGLSQGVDPLQIRGSVEDALKQVNEHFGTTYFIKKIGYIPNDFHHYDLYGRIVFEIIKHLRNDGEFKVVQRST